MVKISAKVCNGMGTDVMTCCSSSEQCSINQGDCDLDSDCSGNLVCGTDNCQSHFPSTADCCEEQEGKLFYNSDLIGI